MKRTGAVGESVMRGRVVVSPQNGSGFQAVLRVSAKPALDR